MAAQAGVVDPYPTTPDGIMAMLQDPSYVTAKYEALQDRKTTVLHLEKTADGHVLKVEREVDANLPDIAKKVLGETNHLIQTETWRANGAGGYDADVVIDSPGKPVKITGTMHVTPDGDANATWKVDFTIKASVPLVGGKIEQIVAKETSDNLAKEYTFNKQWLASH
jgi:hypothetical protein